MNLPVGIGAAADYERLAADRLAAPLHAYLAGGSGDDLTVRGNREAFGRWRLLPRMLSSQGAPRCACRLGGQTHAAPILLAPVALQRLVHDRGERETADGADTVETGMICSTLSSLPIEVIARGARVGLRWFQLYLQPERADTLALLRRAEAAGCAAIVLTIDATIQLPSRRAQQSGFVMPSDLRSAHHPDHQSVSNNPRLADLLARVPGLDDLDWLLNQTRLPVYVKGVLDADEARRIAHAGVAGIVVSNHGGRTIDGVAASLDCVAAIRAAVGKQCEVLMDGGVRSGQDVFKAIALGANAVLIGRLQIYALAVAGALGVAHMLRLLREELEITMAVTGCANLSDINAACLVAVRGALA